MIRTYNDPLRDLSLRKTKVVPIYLLKFMYMYLLCTYSYVYDVAKWRRTGSTGSHYRTLMTIDQDRHRHGTFIDEQSFCFYVVATFMIGFSFDSISC